MRYFTVTKTAWVNCLAFSPDSSRLAAGCRNANVRVWNLGSDKAIYNIKDSLKPHLICFVNSSDKLLIACSVASIKIWDLPKRKTTSFKSTPGYCYDTALSPDGKRVVRVERNIYCLDIVEGQILWKVNSNNDSDVHMRVRFNSIGSTVFVIGKHVAIRDVLTGQEIRGFDVTFRRYTHIYNAVVPPDGQWLALRDCDGIQVRDTSDGRLVFEEPSIRHEDSLAFTPDSARLTAGDRYGMIDFWEVGTWRKESALNFQIGPIQCLTFSSDGLLGAAAGLDGKVVVWDLA